MDAAFLHCQKKKSLPIPSQDLIHSIGLIDYFGDNLVIGLLDLIYDALKPGGKVILGNFHPNNRIKAFMDYIVEWKLNHRTEEQMNQLFLKSKFGKPADRIEFEAEGVNIFAHGVKQGKQGTALLCYGENKVTK